MRTPLTTLVGLALLAATAAAQAPRRSQAPVRDGAAYVPPLREVGASAESELRGLIERYQTDRAALLRLWSVPGSEARRAKLGSFYKAWQGRLEELAAHEAQLATAPDEQLRFHSGPPPAPIG